MMNNQKKAFSKNKNKPEEISGLLRLKN